MRSLQASYPNSNLLVEMYEIEESEQSASLNPSKQRKSSQSPNKSYQAHDVTGYSRRKLSVPQPSLSGSAFAPNVLAGIQGSQLPLTLPGFEKRQIPLAAQLNMQAMTTRARAKSNSAMVMQGLGLKTTITDPAPRLDDPDPLSREEVH